MAVTFDKFIVNKINLQSFATITINPSVQKDPQCPVTVTTHSTLCLSQPQITFPGRTDINRILEWAVSHVCLLSVGIPFSEVHSHLWGWVFHPFLLPNIVPLWIDHICCFHSPVDGHLSCFHFGGMMNAC